MKLIRWSTDSWFCSQKCMTSLKLLKMAFKVLADQLRQLGIIKWPHYWENEALEEERRKPWRTFLSHRLKYFRSRFLSILLRPTTGPLPVVSWGKNLNQSGLWIVVFLLLAVYSGQKSTIWTKKRESDGKFGSQIIKNVKAIWI